MIFNSSNNSLIKGFCAPEKYIGVYLSSLHYSPYFILVNIDFLLCDNRTYVFVKKKEKCCGRKVVIM